jgi:hypothetical protein
VARRDGGCSAEDRQGSARSEGAPTAISPFRKHAKQVAAPGAGHQFRSGPEAYFSFWAMVKCRSSGNPAGRLRGSLHQRPSVVVETGVARGVTSRIVLEALNRNDRGHLWSIDLPHPFEKDLHAQTGAAVPGSHRRRWSYIEGSSRRRLPALLRSLAQVDLFIHDSLHTARNTRFEMEQTLNALAPGGIMIVDDISTHQAFANFAQDFPSLETVVCPHSDRAGSFFGLVHKSA